MSTALENAINIFFCLSTALESARACAARRQKIMTVDLLHPPRGSPRSLSSCVEIATCLLPQRRSSTVSTASFSPPSSVHVHRAHNGVHAPSLALAMPCTVPRARLQYHPSVVKDALCTVHPGHAFVKSVSRELRGGATVSVQFHNFRDRSWRLMGACTRSWE